MRLRAHIARANLAGIVTQLGRMAQLLGLLMALPAGVALVAAELAPAAVFAGLAVVLGLGGRLAARRRREDIGLMEGMMVTALAYLLAAVAGALPFLLVVGPVDALFESMSGITTTGLTVVPLAGLPTSLVFFRAYSQWVGGAGIVIVALAVLVRAARPAYRLYVSEADQEQLLGSVRSTARSVAVVYLWLTAAAVALFAASGMGLFDAVVHAMATVSTGGFSPYEASLGGLPGAAVRVAAIVMMVAGAVSFPLFSRLRNDGPRVLARDPQLRALLLVSAVAAAVMWLAAPADGLLSSLLRSVTALTTTGFSAGDTAAWPAEVRAVAVVLMVVGGSSGSTAGGIKLIRMILLVRLGGWMLARALLPEEAKLPVRSGGAVISEVDLLRVSAFVVVYMGVLALSAVVLSFAGCSFGDALFEAASALGTVGLSVGVTSPELPVWGKAVLILDMWVGRLEIVPVMVLLYPGGWRKD